MDVLFCFGKQHGLLRECLYCGINKGCKQTYIRNKQEEKHRIDRDVMIIQQLARQTKSKKDDN